MDNIRLLMIAGLCIISLLIWQAWQRDYGSLESPWSRPTTSEATTPKGTDVPTVEQGNDASPAVSDQGAEVEGKEGSSVRVTTDVLDLDINKIGAVIEKAKLLEYPVS
ncbi:MAG: hypothetical protein ACRD98_11520, partial [Nitrososphaera sp.]